MAVTDLSGDLPWWLRQGTPTPQGTPPATQGAAPGQSGMGWLNYLGQMFAPNPANTPSANASPMSMVDLGNSAASNGFAVPPADPNQVSPPLNPNSLQGRANAIQPQNPNGQPTPVPAPVVGPPPAPSSTSSSVTMGPAGPPVGAALPDISGVPRMGGPNGVLATQPPTGASAPSGAGLPDLTGVPRVNGVLATNTPRGAAPAAPAASPAAAPAPAGPLSASGGATGQGATSNPRFMGVPFSYDVPGTARSGRGAPIYTAMDLSGLFNRGAANPANVPAANAQPVSSPRVPGPLISKTTGRPMPMSNLPSLYNYPTWPSGGASATNPQAADIARARMLTPNYYGS